MPDAADRLREIGETPAGQPEAIKAWFHARRRGSGETAMRIMQGLRRPRRRPPIVAALALLVAGQLAAAGPVMAAGAVLPPPQVPAGTPVLSASTDLVVLPVTVLNRHGAAVANLTRRDFAVYDNGVRQSIRFFREADAPVTVGLVIDNSGSMQAKLPEVLVGATEFAESSNPLDQIFVVNFDEHVTTGLPPGVPFTSSVAQLEQALSTVAAHGMTALYDAVSFALTHLRAGSHRRRALVVISDGGDDASHLTLKQVLAQAERSNAVIYTVGLFSRSDEDRDPGVLERLAKMTGGAAFMPRKTTDTARVCLRIARMIRSGYTIGYVPAGASAHAGGRHRIRVTVTVPGHRDDRAITRPGYTVAAGPASPPPPRSARSRDDPAHEAPAIRRDR